MQFSSRGYLGPRRGALLVAPAMLVAQLGVACLGDAHPASGDDAAVIDAPVIDAPVVDDDGAPWDTLWPDAEPVVDAGPPGDAGPASRVDHISTGTSHACAVLDNGELRCWGEGLHGRLGYAGANGYVTVGDPNDIGDNETPASVAPVVVGVASTRVAAGDHHTCVRTGVGAIRCWGEAIGGRLGYAATVDLGDDETPASVGDATLDGQVAQIAAGWDHTCVLLVGGAVRCWGYNQSGQLGYGNTDNILVAALATDVDLGGTAIEISAGESHTCALLTGGDVRCWGDATFGQLGYGNDENIGDDTDETPASVSPVSIGGQASHIAAGDRHTCAVLTNGDVRCWGCAENGRLGYGNLDTVGLTDLPSDVDPVSVGTAAADITAGTSHTCVLTTTDHVRCWGGGNGGALGYGDEYSVGWSGDDLPSDRGDVSVGGTVDEVRAGTNFTCALLTTGKVRCWGLNNVGQLGFGDQADRGDQPTTVPSLNGDVPVF